MSEGARFLGEHRVANLDRFFRDLVRDLEEGDVQALLRRLRSGVATGREAEPSRPSDAAGEAVRVMTIHKAKGLDFAHTYLVQLHRAVGARGRSDARLEIEDLDGVAEYRLFGCATPGFYAVERQRERVEQAERVRSLYVAMTRAKNRLVLMGTWPETPVPVEPERANSFLDLFPARHGGVPDLVGEAARLASGSGAQAFDACGARWVFQACVVQACRGQAVKELPHPHPPVAFGFRNVKPDPIMLVV